MDSKGRVEGGAASKSEINYPVVILSDVKPVNQAQSVRQANLNLDANQIDCTDPNQKVNKIESQDLDDGAHNDCAINTERPLQDYSQEKDHQVTDSQRSSCWKIGKIPLLIIIILLLSLITLIIGGTILKSSKLEQEQAIHEEKSQNFVYTVDNENKVHKVYTLQVDPLDVNDTFVENDSLDVNDTFVQNDTYVENDCKTSKYTGYLKEQKQCGICNIGVDFYFNETQTCGNCWSTFQIYNETTFKCQDCNAGTHFLKAARTCGVCPQIGGNFIIGYINKTHSCEFCQGDTFYNSQTLRCECNKPGEFYLAKTEACGTCPEIYNPYTQECETCKANEVFNLDTLLCVKKGQNIGAFSKTGAFQSFTFSAIAQLLFLSFLIII